MLREHTVDSTCSWNWLVYSSYHISSSESLNCLGTMILETKSRLSIFWRLLFEKISYLDKPLVWVLGGIFGSVGTQRKSDRHFNIQKI